MVKELAYLRSLGLVPIGFAGDAGGDERKARRLILKSFPELFIADCWAHQVCFVCASNQVMTTDKNQGSFNAGRLQESESCRIKGYGRK